MKRRLLLASLTAALIGAGCAGPGPTTARDASAGAQRTAWTGRMSLQVDSAPPQSFAALFDLRGSAQAGELVLTTPIGSTLGVLRWSPGRALLVNGGDTREFDSIAALSEAATGAAIPIDALFGWLQGRDDAVAGWRANLERVAEGRLQATRESPQPTAVLRIIFDPS